jgi:peptidoglycan hydrolase-like protein with peptidoglycan-binding domain
MHTYTIIAGAVALAATWSFGPALAQTTTTERQAERAADKAERAADKAEREADKAQREADKAVDRAADTKDTVKDKAERTGDTIKDKTVRAKDKMKDKLSHARDKVRARTGSDTMNDTRAAQQALKTEGFDPGPVDGRMGPRTRAALSDYQRKNDLPVTGMLDDATKVKLDVRSSRAADVPAASPATRPDPKKQNP